MQLNGLEGERKGAVWPSGSAAGALGCRVSVRFFQVQDAKAGEASSLVPEWVAGFSEWLAEWPEWLTLWIGGGSFGVERARVVSEWDTVWIEGRVEGRGGR